MTLKRSEVETRVISYVNKCICDLLYIFEIEFVFIYHTLAMSRGD